MSTASTATHLGPPRQADIHAALLLERMGLSSADLAGAPRERPAVPAFAEYVPVVSAAVTAGTRRAYGSYWNRVLDQWADRRRANPVVDPAADDSREDTSRTTG